MFELEKAFKFTLSSFSDLDFGALATNFALLRLPKMPELKNRKIVGFAADKSDLNEISYV